MAGVSDAERDARLALACVLEPGMGQLADQLALDGPVDLWAMLQRSKADTALAERARRYRPVIVHHDMARHHLRFVVPGDDEWPCGLDELAWAGSLGDVKGGVPLGVWLAGPGAPVRPSAAMVGSRASTQPGEVVTTDIAAGLADAGVTVLSGGAYGIDAAAHQGALSAGGATVAVMAGGLDEVYPNGNARLLDHIRESHLLVSEIAPGSRPSRSRFLARNRLIAALTQVTVVVEAQLRSGAKNTVGWAQRLNRPILAVPGLVTTKQSETPHELIRKGEATLVTCAEHVLEMLRPMAPEPLRLDEPARPLDGLSAEQLAVHEAFPARGARAVDELAYDACVRVRDCIAALSVLELRGLAKPLEDGRWQLARFSN